MKRNHTGHYSGMFLMIVLSFVAMYALMYLMVDSVSNVYANVNQFYMVLTMIVPMVLFELLLMRSMYTSRKMNLGIVAVGVVVFVAAYAFTRNQTFVGDQEFLRSMIPHHGGAVLMCKEAPIRDSEIQGLCKNIISSQQAEIAQMKMILARLK
jgi:predicted neutral ceramidase superfamily lipid hydrolase